MKGTVAAQSAKFSAKFSKGTYAKALATQGLANTNATKASHTVTVTIYFNQQVLQKAQTVQYTAKQGKSGTAQ